MVAIVAPSGRGPSSSAVTKDWNQVASDLCDTGVALVDISESQHIPKAAFSYFLGNHHHSSSGIDALDPISPDADSAHCTGHHQAGGLSSRYNQYREGWVFSDGRLSTATDEEDDIAGVCEIIQDLQSLLHETALEAMNALEEKLHIPSGWFTDSLGPFENSSQWHLKNYVLPQNDIEVPLNGDDLDFPTSINNPKSMDNVKNNNNLQWLPSHTDPSLVSVVILDRPGCQTGAHGLCRWDTTSRDWIPLAYSGHAVAIVLVGSVMAHLLSQQPKQHISGNIKSFDRKSVKACRHCVLFQPSLQRRAAATLFVRPQPQALLVSPPYYISNQHQDGSLLTETEGNQINSEKRPKTFEEWNQRVARNYQKKKKFHANKAR